MNDQKENDYSNRIKKIHLSRFQWILICIALALIIICICLFFRLNTKDNNYNYLSLIISILSSIIAALLCSAFIDIYEMKRKDEFDNDEKRELDENIKQIKNTIKVVANKSIVDSGINNIFHEDQYDADNGFDNQYLESKTAISILIHGRRFVDKHKDAIISRFNKEDFETKWFFVDPDNDFIDIVSKKTGKNKTEIKGYIEKNKQFLIDEYKKSFRFGTLEIYYMHLPPMQAIYIFDTLIIECKYFSSSNKQSSNFVFLYNYDKKESKNEPKSIGNGFYHDHIYIEKESKCVFSSYVLTDRKFKQYLRKKFSDFISDDWEKVHDIHDELDFICVQKDGKRIVFGYRYFKNNNAYEKNSSFCLSQFEKKSKSSNDSLFFIMGKEGVCNEPKHLVLMKYTDNRFIGSFSISSKQLDKFRFKATHFNINKE